jgi:tetratricopeptide (TPR) repeat protein
MRNSCAIRHAFPTRSQRRLALLAAGLLLCLPLGGCKPGDPLEAIREQQAKGEFAATVEPLRDLLIERPGDPEASYLYGRALVATGQPSLAVWSLREAMDDPEWLVPAALAIAQVELVNLDFNEVVAAMTRVLEVEPENAIALLYRAQANAHWKKDPEAALEDAQRALELEPDLLEAYEPLILALLALDRHEEASEALAEAGRRLEATDSPASTLAWHCSTTAIFTEEAGDIERARETWRDCLERYPADPNVVGNALGFYEKRGEWQQSVALLRAALEEAPTQRAFRTALAERLRVTGKAAEGEALLREATRDEDPRAAATAWSDLALFRQQMQEFDAAADALAKSVERIRELENPGPQLLFRYADALVLSGRLERALEVADEIDVPAQQLMIRGRVAQERGDAAQALEQFDEALRVWPDNPFARYYAALAAERLGDFERALEEYRYSIRVSVGATDARTRAAKLLVAQRQPLDAYQVIFIEVKKFPLEPEGKLLSIYLLGRFGSPKQVQTEIAEIAARDPALLPQALARGAEGVSETAGAGAAVKLLEAPGIDYTRPENAPALRALVRYAHVAGKADVARHFVASALAARPKAAVFHEARGLHLELGGDPDGARQAYEGALALDAANAGALAGLGRLTVASDPTAALAYFDRAAAADPSDPEPKLAAARALRASGQAEEATRRLDALLEVHPFEGEAAAECVALDLDSGTVTARTLERARRALRFKGGVEAFEQLSTVYARLGQPERAADAARQAQLLREHRAGTRASSGG